MDGRTWRNLSVALVAALWPTPTVCVGWFLLFCTAVRRRSSHTGDQPVAPAGQTSRSSALLGYDRHFDWNAAAGAAERGESTMSSKSGRNCQSRAGTDARANRWPT